MTTSDPTPSPWFTQTHTTVTSIATPSVTTPPLPSKEFIFGALERNVGPKAEDEQPSRSPRNHPADSAIAQTFSRPPLSHPQKRMAEKGATSGTENDRPSIEDLGKIFDEMTQERLGRRDAITRRWRRKTWAPPIWAIKSGHYNIQVGLPWEFVLYTLVDSSESDAQSFHL
ncbi:hypothetical protein LB505_008322 [Fusarium chuoi]|nr:hypothetical protein LB505_008322 [Fusarium chuoi]